MDSLTVAFYDVMYQYRLPFSPEAGLHPEP